MDDHEDLINDIYDILPEEKAVAIEEAFETNDILGVIEAMAEGMDTGTLIEQAEETPDE